MASWVDEKIEAVQEIADKLGWSYEMTYLVGRLALDMEEEKE